MPSDRDGSQHRSYMTEMNGLTEHLYTQAATFEELLSDRFEALPSQKADADRAAARLSAWCKACTNGDWNLFAKRLAKDGWSLEFVLARFSTVRVNPKVTPPQWLDDATWILSALKVAPEPATAAGKQRDRPALPFEEVFIHLIQEARRRRDEVLPGDVLATISSGALGDLDQQLLSQLVELCMIVLYEEFDRFRESNPTTLAERGNPIASEIYDRFLCTCRDKLIEELVVRYPVWLRLLGSIVRQWIETSAEFITRLARDAAAIRQSLHGTGDRAVAERIEGGVSDLHNFGRSVLIVTFGDERKAVYKPKDVRIDQRWAELIGELNATEPPMRLRAAKVVVSEGYGWTEYVSADECSSVDEVRSFFRRSGALLAIFHLVCGTDMHEENLIASGADPVPIDLEMILQPQLRRQAEDYSASSAEELASLKLSNSVISVGLLPGLFRAADTKIYGVGGINVRGNSETGVALTYVNTDAMQPVERVSVGDNLSNLPQLAGQIVDPQDYTGEMIAGFKEYSEFIANRCTDLLADALVTKFIALPARVVLRITRFYGMVLSRLKEHNSSSDGVTWSVQADFVSRFANFRDADDPSWPLLASERRALYDLNIPFFTCETGTTTISSPQGGCAVCDGVDAIRAAREKVRRYDAQEIDWQGKIAELSFAAADQRAENQFERGMKRSPRLPAAPYDTASLAVLSGNIVAQLEAASIGGDGGAAWIGLCNVPDTDAYQLVPLGPDLHSGAGGIACFLAAHANVTGDAAAREFAYNSLSGLRSILRDAEAARFIRVSGIGGALGVGSFIYALAVCSELLADEDLLRDAIHAAGLVTRDAIVADRAFDVTSGAAGTILGLLKAHQLSRDPSLLATAITCGEHVLEHRMVSVSGHKLWPYLGGPPLAGFSHGAAGYAYALAALGEAAGRNDFVASADDAIRYERSLYSDSQRNWPDFRTGLSAAASYNSCQWCHGAGGIGLARLAMMRLNGRYAAELRDDLGKSVDAVLARWPMQADSLCCGNLGNAMFLADAGRALGRADLANAAQLRLRAIIDDAAEHRTYCWMKGTDQFNLGLFTGLAGAGYSMLRAAKPELPNPLIWD